MKDNNAEAKEILDFRLSRIKSIFRLDDKELKKIVDEVIGKNE